MLCGCATAVQVFTLHRKKLGCVKILHILAKFAFLSMQHFAFWMRNLIFLFAKINRGDRPSKINRTCVRYSGHSTTRRERERQAENAEDRLRGIHVEKSGCPIILDAPAVIQTAGYVNECEIESLSSRWCQTNAACSSSDSKAPDTVHAVSALHFRLQQSFSPRRFRSKHSGRSCGDECL